MWSIRKTLPLAALALLMGANAASASSDRFGEDDIKNRIIGRRIYLATPFGGEFPLNYRRDGQVDGSGEALGLGRFIKPNDNGRWWIKADRLCQQFSTWYDGVAMCFDLYETGGNRLKWVRNDGESGTARIGSDL